MQTHPFNKPRWYSDELRLVWVRVPPIPQGRTCGFVFCISLAWIKHSDESKDWSPTLSTSHFGLDPKCMLEDSEELGDIFVGILFDLLCNIHHLDGSGLSL